MSIRESDGLWTCPDCRQENFPQARYCEVCGKRRGSEEPGPGPAVMARLRGARASAARDDEEADSETAEAEAGRRVKLRFLDFGERVRSWFRRREGGRARGRESGASVLTLVAAFVLWVFIRLVGYGPLLLLIKLVAFLFTPLGLPVWMFLAWYYGRNRRAIHRGIDGFRRQVRAFASMASKVFASMSMLSGGMRNLLQGGPESDDEAPRGRAVRGASVRILEEEWDDDDEEGYDEPPTRRRRR